MMTETPFIVAAVGLDFEARIASAPGVRAVRCPPPPASDDILNMAMTPNCRGIISFGIAGGLDPALRAGDAVVASTVHCGNQVWAADEVWSQSLLRRIPHARLGAISGSVVPVTTARDKAVLYRSFSASIVDMESHVVAAAAARRRLPFAALRIVADGAKGDLPPSALAGRRADGTVAPGIALLALLRTPRELPALMRLAHETWKARRGLARARRLLGPAFGPAYLI